MEAVACDSRCHRLRNNCIGERKEKEADMFTKCVHDVMIIVFSLSFPSSFHHQIYLGGGIEDTRSNLY